MLETIQRAKRIRNENDNHLSYSHLHDMDNDVHDAIGMSKILMCTIFYFMSFLLPLW